MYLLFASSLHENLSTSNVLNQRRFTLKKILLKYIGLKLTREHPDITEEDILEAGLAEEVKIQAAALGIGGKFNKILAQVPKMDIEVNGVAFELDEEYQFNQYRKGTLNSILYKQPLVQSLEHYKQYCDSKFLSKNNIGQSTGSCNSKMLEFPTLLPNEFLKFTALTDFIQDLYPLVHFVPVVRLSVFDEFSTSKGMYRLGELLLRDDKLTFEVVADFISQVLWRLEDQFNLEL